MTTPSVCAKCGNPLTSYYKIERIVNGAPVLSGSLCSIACALSWLSNVAVMVGTMGIMRVKSTVAGIAEVLSGKPKR